MIEVRIEVRVMIEVRVRVELRVRVRARHNLKYPQRANPLLYCLPLRIKMMMASPPIKTS